MFFHSLKWFNFDVYTKVLSLGIYRIITNKKLANITVWKITESEEELFSLLNDADLVQNALAIKAATQRKQFLARHILLKHLSLDTLLYKDENGKPLLKNGNYISITHDSDYVAIMTSPFCCGIDSQSPTNKVFNIQKKYVSEADFCFENPTETNLTLAWCGKEALYKLNGNPIVFFKEHLRLWCIDTVKQEIDAEILHQSFPQKVKLQYRKLDGIFLVYTIVES